MTTPDLYAAVRAGEDLLHAAGHGRVEGVKRALAQGADVNTLRSDQTALMGSTSRRSLDCVQVLIEHGANVDLKNRMGWAPIHEAAAKDFSEIVEVLATGGANVDAHDRLGVTPLIAAIRNKSNTAALKLLEVGASAQAPDFDGKSPVMWAVVMENDTLLSALVARGAPLAHKDQAGRTAMDFAKESGWDLGLGILEQAARIQAKATAQAEDVSAEAVPAVPMVSKIGKRKMG